MFLIIIHLSKTLKYHVCLRLSIRTEAVEGKITPFESIICVLSKREHFELLRFIANKMDIGREKLTSATIISKLSVTKTEFKLRSLALMSNALIRLVNDQYELTQLGKEVFDTLNMIEEAIAIRMKLKAVDLISRSECTTTAEFDKILSTLVKNTEVRKILKQRSPNQYVRIGSKINRRS
jgi:hypothetical protein